MPNAVLNQVTAKAASTAALKTSLLRSLLLDMFAGRIKSGDRLVEEPLAERYGVSRTPVREALFHLSAIGLVALRPNCGAVMLPLGLRQIRDIYEVREILEVEACRRACGGIAPVLLKDLSSEFESLAAQRRHDGNWTAGEWAADCRLHETVAQHCGNPRLAHELARYAELIQIVRETVGGARQHVDAVYQHLKILRPLLKNDPDAAADAMRDHIKRATKVALDALRRHLPD